jgi:CheY-like chemotaxis protein
MRVLFVDDEPNVLDSIRRQLRKVIEIETATSGPAALKLLDETGPVALVISDMRMPDMSGAELLTEVRARHPDTVRMILSGQADLESTIAAVNDGRVFRFLTKPCATEALQQAVAAGLEQYQLITTRKELLDKTLQGLVETLTDILGLTNPAARRRTGRVRQYATAIAGALKFHMPWDLRLATLLSQLGCITLPIGILDKVYAGTPLSEAERQVYSRHPDLAAGLIRRIPQLGPVAAMIGRQQQPVDFSTLPATVADWEPDATATVILAVSTHLDELLATGEQPAAALRRLEEAMPGLPRTIIEAVRTVHLHSAYMEVQMIGLDDLTPGMVLDEDLTVDGRTTIMFRGEEITRGLLEQLKAESGGQAVADLAGVPEKLRVLVPA